MSDTSTPLTLRVRELTGRERMLHPKRYILECGYDRERGNKAKGGMVAIYFDNDVQLPEVLEILAELWTAHRHVCEGEADRSRLVVINGSTTL